MAHAEDGIVVDTNRTAAAIRMKSPRQLRALQRKCQENSEEYPAALGQRYDLILAATEIGRFGTISLPAARMAPTR
jgi:hypothetical protein